MGAPTLRVRDLESTVSFYERDLGFDVKDRRTDSDGLKMVGLGPKLDDEPILRLKHDPDARTFPHDSAGLYHFAILLPQRKDLASTFLSIGSSGVPFEGFADHSFSESLYLHDAERNGIEIYADRPRHSWPDWNSTSRGGDGGYAAMNKPLDFDSLLRELSSTDRTKPRAFSTGTKIGHMHLRVTDLERSVRFYHETLGFDLKAHMPELGAAFLSVAGYHHHLGLNTWHSKRGSPHVQGDAGLEEFRMLLPSEASLDSVTSRFPDSERQGRRLRITDPDDIPIVIESPHG
jgi:catechol 2,3-dioxygenase